MWDPVPTNVGKGPLHHFSLSTVHNFTSNQLKEQKG